MCLAEREPLHRICTREWLESSDELHHKWHRMLPHALENGIDSKTAYSCSHLVPAAISDTRSSTCSTAGSSQNWCCWSQSTLSLCCLGEKMCCKRRRVQSIESSSHANRSPHTQTLQLRQDCPRQPRKQSTRGERRQHDTFTREMRMKTTARQNHQAADFLLKTRECGC